MCNVTALIVEIERMLEKHELGPAEREELERLCNEYAVATNCVVKAVRVVNPLERVGDLLREEERAVELLSRIKADLKAPAG